VLKESTTVVPIFELVDVFLFGKTPELLETGCGVGFSIPGFAASTVFLSPISPVPLLVLSPPSPLIPFSTSRGNLSFDKGFPLRTPTPSQEVLPPNGFRGSSKKSFQMSFLSEKLLFFSGDLCRPSPPLVRRLPTRSSRPTPPPSPFAPPFFFSCVSCESDNPPFGLGDQKILCSLRLALMNYFLPSLGILYCSWPELSAVPFHAGSDVFLIPVPPPRYNLSPSVFPCELHIFLFLSYLPDRTPS